MRRVEGWPLGRGCASTRLAAAASVLLWPGVMTACPLTAQDGQRVSADGGAVQLAWRTEPKAIKVGEPFVLWLRVCPRDALLKAVDATMPEHRHGMNYQPALQPQAAGRWRAEGLLWHMSGRWEWRFDLESGGAVHSLRQSVVLR